LTFRRLNVNQVNHDQTANMERALGAGLATGAFGLVGRRQARGQDGVGKGIARRRIFELRPAK
jgi:hypothetical protein